VAVELASRPRVQGKAAGSDGIEQAQKPVACETFSALLVPELRGQPKAQRAKGGKIGENEMSVACWQFTPTDYFRRMKEMQIANGKYVEISYILREDTQEGEELEICPADEAFGFMVGENQVLVSLEKALLGMKKGDSFAFRLSVDEAYGEEDEEAFVEVPKSAFIVDGELDESVFEEGEVVPMETEDGEEVIGVVAEVRLNSVIVDFNHPFAAMNLHFTGEILNVADAPPQGA
jgi:FKBP-type peptidyl-prolyl cis-trans isomerase SlyD|tara:strand:+ start:3735 stop:4436 length:702 start_codon:yes stop_codon:yes gene_type:complete